MANYMAEVAKMLGVELGEEFEIEFPAPSTVSMTAVFKENEFRIVKTDAYIMTPYWNYSVLHSLLVGSLIIKHKPWKPNDEERYWYVDERGRIWSDYFDYYSCASHCMNYYKLGNCYRTCEEAEANRDKWVKFYSSDEVLEV